ncbi:hypothetical protein [Tomitella cavernea]|uniref:hypothetical protein n=1 Tax=Tomitella cavernea TaxID=1387982 RepID=UPI0019032143|nr:hypothetical protein [Tomitella cavernea]
MAVVVVSWGATVLIAARLVMVMVREGSGPGGVDGTWFLLPAAPLAGAIAVAGLADAGAAGSGAVVGWFAMGAAAAGAFGYAAVAVAAVASTVRRAGRFRASVAWWISAGCAGLAAAALGQASAISAIAPTLGDSWAVRWCVWVYVAVASALLVPIIGTSAVYLAHRRRVSVHAPWPPTFSMGVYALGVGQADRLARDAALQDWHRVAAAATLVLWAGTAAVQLYGTCRRQHECGSAGPPPD